jgi:hypothetical protein
MRREPTLHLGRTRPVDVRSSASGTLSPIRLSAAYTIDTLEYSFRKRQGIEMPRPTTKAGPHSSGDPSDPLYQEEYEAHERYVSARDQLRASLERGDFEAAALDPFSGTLHPVPASLWRRHGADRMIEKGQAPIPASLNTGKLLVKRFAEAKEAKRPLPKAKIREAIAALKEKLATESLTRPQQADFLRQSFASYQLTEQTIREIFRAVAVPPGRPKKSDKGS